jgi:hypothetical protein
LPQFRIFYGGKAKTMKLAGIFPLLAISVLKAMSAVQRGRRGM